MGSKKVGNFFGRITETSYFCSVKKIKMSSKEKIVMQRIREVAHRSIPKGGHARLYGSYARGDAHQGSDWDILILLDKDNLEQTDFDQVSYPFILLGCDIGEEINPIMYTKKEWESYKITPFYENVTRDSINLV